MKDGTQKIEYEIPLAELDKTVARIFDRCGVDSPCL